MTKENILKNIYTIEGLASTHSSNYKLNDAIKKLIEDLKRDILLEENKDVSGGKKRLNAVLKMLDKGSKQKPVLKYCTYDIEGYQAFTNCFMACFLTEADQLPIEAAPSNVNYPSLSAIYETASRDTSLEACFKIKVNKILSYKKVCKKIDNLQLIGFYNPINDFKMFFDLEQVINVINALDLKNNDDFIIKSENFNYRSDYYNRPVIIKNKNSSLALLMPVRKNENIDFNFLESEEF